jgi:hypothetical protein
MRRKRTEPNTFIENLQRHPGAELYAKVLRADPCSYCGSRDTIWIDHIVPLGPVGEAASGFVKVRDLPNVTAACRACNLEKRCASLLHFLLERRDEEYVAAGSRRWADAYLPARQVEIPRWEPDETLAVAQTLASQLGEAGVLVARLIWQARVDAGWRPLAKPR